MASNHRLNLADLRVVVTGASSGIGLAYARALRARGERVVLVARRADRLEALARELGGEPSALALPADLAVPGVAAGLVHDLDARGIGIHGLVNCAGLGHTGPFDEASPETIRTLLDVNVRAVVELTRAALPGMRARDRGWIVNVASNAAFQPVPYLTLYAATKAFVLSFSEGLAEELRGSGVSVQALCPGLTATEFLEVAGTDRSLPVNRLPLMSAQAVVRESLAGLDRRRVRVVAGWTNRALGFVVQRLAPRALSRRVAGALYRPRRAPGV
jgi:uncharacterized protein